MGSHEIVTTTNIKPAAHVRSSAATYILPHDYANELKATKRRSIASRLNLFCEWLDTTGREWIEPDLREYVAFMKRQGKAASTINAHVSTIRARYRELLDMPIIEDVLYHTAARRAIAEHGNGPRSDADRRALRLDLRERIEKHLNVKRVPQVAKQDRDAGEFKRLTRRQAETLIGAPGTDTLKGLRDTALIALALTTGARIAELCALDVGDHRARTEDNALALLIRDGKGRKQRLVPYGALDFAPVIVDAWLDRAGIASGAIFRGFQQDGKQLRDHAMTPRAVQQMLESVSASTFGTSHTVKPHDLRRTYARLAYESGVKPVAIQQNLGHANLQTTLGYIGNLDTKDRQPGAFLRFDLSKVSAR